jgi:hypothetical protein
LAELKNNLKPVKDRLNGRKRQDHQPIEKSCILVQIGPGGVCC